VKLFEALPEDEPSTAGTEGVPFKRLYMFQDGHASPSAPNWQPLLDRFFAHTLRGADNGVDADPEVLTEGRSAGAESTGFRLETSWPPPETEAVPLYLGRGAGGELSGDPVGGGDEASYTDTATQTEEGSKLAPAAEANWLFYRSAPLARRARMAGEAVLRATVSVSREHAHLTPILVDVAPDGTTKTVSRGFLNLLYRNGLGREQPMPVGEPVPATVTFKPQDQIFEAGHRIGVIVQSSNTAWAIPDDPGAAVTLHHGGSSALTVPLVDPPLPPALFR
jgi:X-Pro dipeptidyl-peptidase